MNPFKTFMAADHRHIAGHGRIIDADPNGAYLRSFEEGNCGSSGYARIKTSVIRAHPRNPRLKKFSIKRHSMPMLKAPLRPEINNSPESNPRSAQK